MNLSKADMLHRNQFVNPIEDIDYIYSLGPRLYAFPNGNPISCEADFALVSSIEGISRMLQRQIPIIQIEKKGSQYLLSTTNHDVLSYGINSWAEILMASAIDDINKVWMQNNLLSFKSNQSRYSIDVHAENPIFARIGNLRYYTNPGSVFINDGTASQLESDVNKYITMLQKIETSLGAPVSFAQQRIELSNAEAWLLYAEFNIGNRRIGFSIPSLREWENFGIRQVSRADLLDTHIENFVSEMHILDMDENKYYFGPFELIETFFNGEEFRGTHVPADVSNIKTPMHIGFEKWLEYVPEHLGSKNIKKASFSILPLGEGLYFLNYDVNNSNNPINIMCHALFEDDITLNFGPKKAYSDRSIRVSTIDASKAIKAINDSYFTFKSIAKILYRDGAEIIGYQLERPSDNGNVYILSIRYNLLSLGKYVTISTPISSGLLQQNIYSLNRDMEKICSAYISIQVER